MGENCVEGRGARIVHLGVEKAGVGLRYGAGF